jgi:very-short-patch-repair endonuclease
MRQGEDAARSRALRRQRTDAEHRLWQHLRGRRLLGAKFRRQVQVGPYFVDFLCIEARLAIELDGSQHLAVATYDERRTSMLESRGLRVLRFWNDDALARTEEVLSAIVRALEGSPRAPSGDLVPRAGKG